MTDTPTVSDMLPPKVRQWVYALLLMTNGGYVVAEAAYDIPVAVLVVIGAISAAGFGMAVAKTNPPTAAPDAGFVESNVVWTIVGILAIVALIIWIAANT